MRFSAPLFALVLAPGLAFGDPMIETVTANNSLTAAPTEWLGAAPHLVIMGTVNGNRFDVQAMDLAAADIIEVTMKREYLLTNNDYNPYREVDFAFAFTHDGIAKAMEAKLTHADFNKLAALPATFALQSAEEYPEGGNIFTELEYKWEAQGKTVDAEIAEWTGTATLNLDDAYQAAKPNGDGMVGGYINASNGDNTIVISFTLPVTEFEIED